MTLFRQFFSRLAAETRAITSIEFALLAPTFALLICVSLDFGITMLTQQVLDNATRDASRLIETGSVQSAGGAATPFVNQLCTDVGKFIPCASIQYNVQSANSFSSLNDTVKTGASGAMTGTGFAPGTPGQDVLVQVGYLRPTLIPWVGQFYNSKGDLLIVSTVAFQNDPY